jgi:plastocyanin
MKRLVLTFGLIVVAGLVAACGGSNASPSTSAPAASAGTGDAITIVAKDIAWSPTTITAPAGKAFTIVLDNRESAPHNILISDASGHEVFKGEIITQKQITYSVNALAAGSYPFKCEVHPNMTGTLTVQ